ncbi:cob(I)yrinic acid a,c-diamide adenosyltransferase [Paenibacillus timonensis]|uniref:cob(I)yrinic acid a,c-diamide adenosyltransferase n=1 Tax=Paenibacillus sp. FSL R7-0216 TaxID=2921677 RepID=UPI0012D8F890|nr:cob(I)yrinic acid a,c-diamide adenosyltransferase [Paenibacillus timonensis]MUG87366.1 cob(I)yrinic acid a,c-diamide adenosyltransferase [Paenibacillus timonensis]
MSIYTRSGDQGQTSVIGGRVTKDDAQVEAYGTIDELNSFVGQAVCLSDEETFGELHEQLLQIQQELFDCGSDLAYVKLSESRYKVTSELAEQLEAWIDRYELENPPLEKFILPGGTPLAAVLHICRTVCRRAERGVVTLGKSKEINAEVLKYLNRLSDYFFAAARNANHRAKVADIEYVRSGKVFGNK